MECAESKFKIEYVNSLLQRADIFTKAFRGAAKRRTALQAINIALLPRGPDHRPKALPKAFTANVAMPAGRGNATAGADVGEEER